ncbi:unnamed protein product, partial [Allacma fusca]
MDSGIGSVVKGYYSYTLSDREHLSSPGETTAAETDPGSEGESTSPSKTKRLSKHKSSTFTTTSGEPGDPESSPSESSDDDPASDHAPEVPNSSEGGEQGGDPGDQSGEDQ